MWRYSLGQTMNAPCKILGHDTALNGVHTDLFKGLGEPAGQKQKQFK